MKRAASPGLMEVVADSVDPSETEVITEIVTELPIGQENKRQRTEEEVCLDDGYFYLLVIVLQFICHNTIFVSMLIVFIYLLLLLLNEWYLYSLFEVREYEYVISCLQAH